MKKILLFTISVLFSAWVQAQLSGTKTIPGDYATLVAAVTDLNAQGVGSGGVTFNVTSGYTETITAPLLITATGTSANPIVFQKSGAGSNPVITRTDAGTLTTSTLGGQGDAVILVQGADYLSFDGIDVSASSQTIEYGYYLRKGGVTDGCKNVSIKNAVITLTKGTSAYVAGIYSSNNDASSTVSSATGITVTSTGGRNENISITGNTIQNVFTGILLRGFNHTSAPYDFYDQNYTIGGAAGQGNTIQNYGGNTASTSYGVYLIYHNNPVISYNTVNNTAGGGSPFTSTGYGVFHSNATNFTGTYNNNSFTLSSTTGQLRAITAGSSGISTITANNNTITLSQAGTSEASGIYLQSVSAGSTITVSGNTVGYGTFGSTTTSYMIYCSNAASNITADGNQSAGNITKTGAGTFYGYYNFGSPTGGVVTISNNNFSNITLTGASTFYGIYQGTSTTQIEKITGNTVSNITGGTSSVFGIHHNYGAAGSEVSGNVVSGITGGGAVTGIQLGNSTASLGLTVFNNQVKGLSGSGAATVAGILHVNGASSSIYKNKVYDIQSTNAGGFAYGLQVSGGASVTAYNNLIGDIRTPAANAAIPLAGIYVSGGTTVNLFYNTVYLNGSSTGALFGSAALYASTTPALTLQNNIFVNASVASGAGLTAAYRRSSTTLTSYGSASNNNLFYAGTPGAANVIFTDGTNSDQTLADFKTRVTSRDAASVTENASFVSTSGSSASFLHINTASPTQIESGGISVAGITDDYDGDARNASTPDIGADEGSFILLDMIPPAINYTALGFTCASGDRMLTATVTDPSGVPVSGAGLPVLYWKINTGTYQAATGTHTGGNSYQFSFGNGAVTGDVVSYYIVAQDNAGTPNVGAFPSGGAGGFTANPPAAATAPTTPSSYTISTLLNGTYQVGAGQTFPTLTAAVTAYNNSCIGGPVVFELTDAAYGAGETFPLVINANSYASATNTLTIRPAAGVTSSISGALANGALIRILGNHVIIDGSNSGTTTRDLSISNTSATGSTVILIGSTGASSVTGITVKNAVLVNGVNTSTALVVSDAGTPGNPGNFTNVILQNNSVQKAYIGFYINATVAAGNGSGLLVTGNALNSTGVNAIRYTGIYIQGVDGATVSGNAISGFDGASGEDDKGIWLATGTRNSKVSGNTINGLAYTGTTGYGAQGLYLSTGVTDAGILVYNNSISGISGDGWNYTTTPLDNPIGIAVTGTQTGIGIYHNSIHLSGNTLNKTSAMSMGIYLGNGSVADIRNNIIVNNLGLLSATGYGATGIYAATANTQFTAINNNAYYANPSGSGVKYIGQIGSTGQSLLADWAAATGGDTRSVLYQPVFVSATDLHLQNTDGANWCLEGAAVPLAVVTTDLDGDTRSLTKPDIGADEFNAAGFMVTSPAAICAPATVDLTAASVTTGSMAGLTFGYFTDEACTNAVANPAAVTATGTYYIKATTGSCSLVLPVSVTVNAQPVAFTVTGGGTSCSGTPVAVGLDNSASGINYQLVLDGTTNVGSPVSGTGAALSFGSFTVAGTYTVVATDAVSGCTAAMTGSAVITAAMVPADFTVTGGGTACGTDEVAVGLSGSESGVNYQLFRDGSTSVGAPVAGTGSAVSFGFFNTAGVYTVRAVNALSGCSSDMTGSATITAGVQPVISYVLTQPNNCNSNNGGAALTISGAPGPYTFVWTGAGIIQGQQDQSTLRVGPYTVTVTAANGCSASASLTLTGPGGCDICPAIGSLATDPSGGVCLNATATFNATGLNSLGNTYGIIFKYSTTPLADPYTGGTVIATVDNTSLTNGGTAATATGLFTTTGIKYVYAVLSPTPFDPACRPFQQTMVNVNALPVVDPVTNVTVCNNGSVSAINFSGTTGATFNWTNNNTTIGLAASGTGDIPGFAAVNTTNAPVSATITVTPVYTSPSGTYTENFAYTGAVQTWTVPAGVTSVTVTANGAQGGTVTIADWSPTTMDGALGGRVTTNLSVTPGQVLNIYVGGKGGNTNPAGAPGGFNGGGNAASFFGVYSGGSGGGASDIRIGGTALSNRVVVAGGGGGAGGDGGPTAGGAGGGLTGQPAANGNNPSTTEPTGGTQTEGGAAGSLGGYSDGTPGTLGVGGNSTSEGGIGAGGGGGYYGGGGGTWAGGAGGSSYTDPVLCTDVTHLQGANAGDGSISISYELFGGATCSGTPETFTITVNPTPVVDAVPNQAVCNGGSSAAITFTGAVAGTVYNWINDNTSIGLAASGSGNIGAFTAVNTGSTPVVATVTVTPSYTNEGVTCTGTPVSFTITVNPTPDVVAAPASQTICSGTAISPVSFSSAVSGTTYSWTRDNTTTVTGIAAGGTGNITGTLTNTTSSPVTVTFTVTPSANGCSGTPVIVTVLVNPTPNVVATPASQNSCSGSAITSIALSSSVSGTTYAWSRDNTTNVTGIAASGSGNISGTLTNNTAVPQTVTFTIIPGANGCNGPATTATVVVNPLPTITCPSNISVNADAGICGAVVNYPAAVATGFPAPVVTYSHASGSTFPVGTTTVTATATNSCGTVTCSFTVTVVDNQAPVLTCPANINATAVGACTAVVNYTVNATDNCPGVTVTRIAGPASGSAFPIGTTTVTHRATDAAGNSSICSFTVTVADGQLPVINVQPVRRSTCVGGSATFSVTATNAVSYQWQNWTGTAWANIAGATAATYTVTNAQVAQNTSTYRVIVNGLCNTVTSVAATLTVNTLPNITLSANGSTQLLPGQTVSLTASGMPAGGSYSWYRNGNLLNGVNGSVISGISVDQTGLYRVSYTDVNGCTSNSPDLVISAMPSLEMFVAPNPNTGQFSIRVFNQQNEELMLRIFDAKGGLVYARKVTTGPPYTNIQVDLQKMGIPPAGVYHAVLFNAEGRRLGMKQLVVYR